MWHTKTWQWPENEEWEVEGAGLLMRDEFVSPDALRMEYGPLFAYLFRRFGPPEEGSDPHKEIACWYLTTPDPDVILWVSPRPSGAKYSFGYGVNGKHVDTVREELSGKRAVITALQATMEDLLVPTNVRDVFINAIGNVPDAEIKHPVEPFIYAGIGIDHKALAELAKEEGD